MLSIFGLSIGANGENVDRIRDIYSEKIKLENTVHNLTEYESYSTSPTSFLVYDHCMHECMSSHKISIKAFKIAENAQEVSIDLYLPGRRGGYAEHYQILYNALP